MAETSTYTVLLALGGPDGKTYTKGSKIELTDADAKIFHKHKAIGLYLGEDDDAPEAELPKAKKRTGKPTSIKTLDDSDLLTPDPNAGRK